MQHRIDRSEAVLWRDVIDLVLSRPMQRDGLVALAERILLHLDGESCALYLLDRRTEELRLAAQAGDAADVAQSIRLGQGIIGLAAYQQRAIQIAHGQDDPRARVPGGRPSGGQTVIAVPIYEEDQLLGVMSVRRRGTQYLAAAEMESVESIVPRLVTVLVRNTTMKEVLDRRTYELQALNELGQAMNAGLDLDETLELIATRAVETLDASGAAVRLIVEDGTLALATMVAAGETRFDSDHERRIAEYVAGSGEPLLIDDVHAQEDRGEVLTSMVCVPLVLEERVVGTLSLLSRVPSLGMQHRLSGAEDLDMLFALSSQIAAEIEDIRLTVRLQGLIRTEKQQGEALRELYNRSQALLQSISDGLVAINRDGTIQEINAVAARILGLEASAVRQRPIDALVEDKPPVQSWVESGEQFSNRVITLRSADGRVAAMANLQPVMDGGRTAGAVLTFREMREVGRFVNRMIGAQRTFTFGDIIGSGSGIEKTKDVARIAAGTASTILIQGETGTGKEVLAQSIHNASSFSDGPFLAVNCAAIPRDLIESELFGYVEGAFTGASRKGHLGKFELASGGTLFLDEVGDIPPDVQVKLLRVLQEKAIVRVGGDRTIPINCRLIAATHRDLQAAVDEHGFRRDLLYRLNVITIDIPPLRERIEDIPLFVQHFIKVYAERNSKVVDGVTEAAQRLLCSFQWRGNVRELENAIEHSVAMVKGRLIRPGDLPAQLQDGRVSADVLESGAFEGARKAHEAATKNLYVAALKAEGGSIVGAAQRLGVSRATLYRRLKQHGLQRSVADLRHTSQY